MMNVLQQEDWDDVLDTAKEDPCDWAVSAATAGLAERGGEHAKTVKEQVQDFVKEPKPRRGARITSPVNNIEPTNVETSDSAEEKGV